MHFQKRRKAVKRDVHQQDALQTSYTERLAVSCTLASCGLEQLAMDLRLSAEHIKFRDEARAWLQANLRRPWREEWRDPKATEDSLMELRRKWQRTLHKGGYLGMDWPKEWGGR